LYELSRQKFQEDRREIRKKPSRMQFLRRRDKTHPEKFRPISSSAYGLKVFPPKIFRAESLYGQIFLPRKFSGRSFSGSKILKSNFFPVESWPG